MRKTLFLALLGLCVSLPLFAATAAEEAAQGLAALNRHDADTAVGHLEKAIAAEPNNAEYHYLLGTAYSEQGLTASALSKMSIAKKAMAELERAVELNPKHLDARYALASFYIMAPGFMGGGEEKAFAQAEAVKRLDAFEGHRVYGRLYTTQKKPDLALKEYVEAVRENPKSAKAHYYLGTFYMTEKKYDAARHELETAVQLDAAFMLSYLRLGQVSARSGTQIEQGEAALRKYLAYSPTFKEPNHAPAWLALGLIQEKQGKKTDAKASYGKGLKLSPEDKDLNEALKRVS